MTTLTLGKEKGRKKRGINLLCDAMAHSHKCDILFILQRFSAVFLFEWNNHRTLSELSAEVLQVYFL